MFSYFPGCYVFEKVLKANTANYETMKILDSLYAQSDDPEKLSQDKVCMFIVKKNPKKPIKTWWEYSNPQIIMLTHKVLEWVDLGQLP